MRLYDKILTQCINNPVTWNSVEVVRKTVDHTSVLVCDNIASHYYNLEKMEFEANDFPYVILPWKFAFIEWEIPEHAVINGNLTSNMGQGAQCGVFAVSLANNRKEVDVVIKELIDWTQSNDLRIDEDVTNIISLTSFISSRGVTACEGYTNMIFINKTGLCKQYSTVGSLVNKFVDTMGSEAAQIHFATSYHIFGYAMTFLNCKNVVLQDKSAEYQPPAKIMRRLKIPSVKRYTLLIDKMRGASGKDSDNPQSGVMPYHLCRGHFATYTDEKPLFGKYTGKFWIPQHMKGKKENGEIIKDYKI